MNSEDPAKLQTLGTFNSVADHFDDQPLSFWNRFGRATIERLSLPAGAAVLDVCCGSGASALPGAQAVGPEGRVIGVDLADKLLELARSKAAAQGLQNVEFRVGDMENLQFADGSFDAVVCVFGIFFVEDMASQIAELWRMTKPGGQLAITTWGERVLEPAYSLWQEAVKKNRPDLYEAHRPWDRTSREQTLRSLFTQAGVPDVQITSQQGWHQLATSADWRAIVQGTGLRWTLDKLGSDAGEAILRANQKWLSDNAVTQLEVNVLYGLARKAAPL